MFRSHVPQLFTRFAIIGTLFGFLPTAHAGRALQGRSDWKNDSVTDSLLKVSACRTLTSAVLGSAKGELSINIPTGASTGASTLPYVLFKIPARKKKISRFAVSAWQSENEDSGFDSQDSFSRLSVYLVAPGVAKGEPDIYWAPLEGVQAALGAIDSLTALSFFYDGEEQGDSNFEVIVSLRGSSAALKKLAACAGRAELAPAALLKYVLDTSYSQVSVGEKSFRHMLDTSLALDAGFAVVSEKRGAVAQLQTQIDALKTPVASQLSQLDSLRRQASDLTVEKSGLDAKVADAQTRLTQLPAEIASTQSALVVLQNELAAIKVKYDPLALQIAPYDRIVAQRNDDDWNASIALNRALLDKKSAVSAVNEAQSSIDSLQSDIDSLQRQVLSAQSDLTRVQSDLSVFNLDLEKRKILINNSRYNQAQNELASTQQQLTDARGELHFALDHAARADREQSQCRQNPSANCSAQDSEASIAHSAFDQLKSRLDSLQDDSNRLALELRKIEVAAEQGAFQLHDQLVSDRDRFLNALSDTQGALLAKQSTQQSLGLRLPALQQQVSIANQNYLQAQTNMQRADSAAAAARADRRAAADRIGFTPIEASFDSKQAQINDKQRALAALQSEQSWKSAGLPTWQSRVGEIVALLNVNSQQIQALETQVAPALAQVAVLTPALDAASALQRESENVFASTRDLYRSLSRVLLGN